MSKTDPCLKCGQIGHTSSSCKRPYFIPAPLITVEPLDGTEGMVTCEQCARRGIPDYQGRGGCIRYVPSMAQTPQHCAWHRRITRPTRPTAQPNRTRTAA